MKFKIDRLEGQYQATPARLQEICQHLEALLAEIGKPAIVTRVTDPVDGESGVHRDFRAVDFRYQYCGVYPYPREQAEKIKDELNRAFPRKDRFQVCVLHSFQGGAYHYHVQIPLEWVTHEDLERRRLYVESLALAKAASERAHAPGEKA